MLCEKCGNDIETIKCIACGESIQKLGEYCYVCGANLTGPVPATEIAEASDDSLDFDDRILCSDGTCIGVINKEGVCKVCGKPYNPNAE